MSRFLAGFSLFFSPKNQRPSFGAKEAKLWEWLHCAEMKNHKADRCGTPFSRSILFFD